ncbi:MAG: hypothetical protein HQ481_18635 [Alphaproteobacteria bacterium]|nr:hypothetical protein [Alphaproteobacteria bacterium]
MALIAILGVVWYGFKLVGRLDKARREKVASGGSHARDRAERPGAAEQETPSAPANGVVDLVKDEKTGAYVTKEHRDHRA